MRLVGPKRRYVDVTDLAKIYGSRDLAKFPHWGELARRRRSRAQRRVVSSLPLPSASTT